MRRPRTTRGAYSVPLLPVSAYLVTAEKEGFKLAASSANELKVDQVLRVDLTMELGMLSETVEVVGRSVALDSETAGIGHVITEKQVTELPLNGRNFLQLLFLGNGAVETTRRAGRDEAGRRQRDQHQRVAADLQQLHARRHVEHRHGARDPGRHPVD